MEQTGRTKTKYTSPNRSSLSHTRSTKQATDARASSDTYWKYTQRNNEDVPEKSTRRHQSTMAEPTVSHYSSTNSYRTTKRHTCPWPAHPKQSSIPYAETPHRYQQATRKKDYSNKAAVVNKDRYKNERMNENNMRYVDEELENFTEDNLEDDAEEEAGNDRERIGETLDEEYDEQEEDDEIDEESDVPAEPHVKQRDADKKSALPREQQRLQTINRPQNPHISPQHPYSKLYQCHPAAIRYYHHVPERDIQDALYDEDLYTSQALKNLPRRSSAGYQQDWIPQRGLIDRYDTATLPIQPNHRVRTRPEIKSFIETASIDSSIDRRKCGRCGNMSILKKRSPSRRNNSRFQDNVNFARKEHYGDEILDQSWCGHCKPKHHLNENIRSCEIPSSPLYSMKSRRSRDTSIPMQETLEGKRAMDEISHEYTRIPARYTKDTSNNLRDRIRHPIQSTQGSTRISACYDS